MPRAFVRPVTEFMENEAAGAILMLVAAIVAVVWANSPWQESYFELWATPLVIELGGVLHVDLTLEGWVNDALMAIFFFVVALEIKRELVQGELNDRKKAALPAMAALGGMILPALIYLAFNVGTDAVDGWGIPVATDIAFAVGVVALVGPRIPASAKIFLLTLAIVDDVGGIIVIAVFYTSDISVAWLAAGVVAIVLLYVFQRVDIRAMTVYVAGAGFIWFAFHESGVHATIAGVVLGLLTPAWAFYDPSVFAPQARALVGRIQRRFDDQTLTVHEAEENDAEVAGAVRLSQESIFTARSPPAPFSGRSWRSWSCRSSLSPTPA
ncbi:MAG: Na+/H+ antiporter NhaA [Acidimicrobiia bacterium]|nr:Na+/H+ antiporter NhaA [Acidimicrobiia bacterium]